MLQDFVGVVVREDHFGLEGFGFLKVHEGIGHDDNDVADLHFAGGCSVEADASTASLTSDDVCVEAFAIVVVDDIDTFACNQTGGIHQVFVNGDAAHVVKIGFSHLYTMQLRFQYFNLHGFVIYS